MEVVKSELSLTPLCNACLSIGRKLHDITDEKCKLFYFSALTEIPLFDMASIPTAICWECKIMLKRAVEFREQVKDSYRILVTCTTDNIQDCLLSDVSRPSRFKVTNNDKIDIQPTCTFELYDDCETKNSFDDDIGQDVKDDFKSTNRSENIENCTQSVFVKEEQDIKQEGFESDLNADDNVARDNQDIDKEIKSLLTEVDSKKKLKKLKKGKRKIEKGRKSKKKKCKQVPNSTSKITTVDLTYEQMTEERLLEYTKESYINAEYKCEDCILGFNYMKSYKAHIAAKHSQDIGDYTCPICKTVLVSVDAFTAHYKRHMRRYECSICQKRTTDFKAMEQHYYTHHEISLKKYKCKECGKISKSIDSHRYHMDSHKTRLECSECDKTFRHRGGLLNHRLTVHQFNNAFPCDICNKTFRWKSSLKRHMESHDDKNKSSSNAAFCVLCNISFGSLSSYQRHMTNSLKHVTKDDFRFICDHCKRRFANKTKLRDHIEEKHLHMTYQCHICLKVSKNRVNLDQHIRNVHKGRPNNKICHHCGKGFPTKVQLESHIRTHTGERPFICEFCPTTFSQQSNLYKHNRQVHLNMKSKRYPLTKKRKDEGIPISIENDIAMQYNPVDIDFHILP